MDLSIIVPIYNTPKEILNKCFNSIQDGIKEIQYELLLIDDGSNIEIANYCKQYARRNQILVKYIRKENGGVSSARNLGIEKACGKYIMFVDSDDVLISNVITISHLIIDADIVFYNKVLVTKNKVNNYKEINGESRYINHKELLEKMIRDNAFHSPFSKLYKLSFLKQNYVFFDTSLIEGEDAIFNLDILVKKPVVFYIDETLYKYNYQISTLRKRFQNHTTKMFENYMHIYVYKKNILKELFSSNQVYLYKKLYSNTIYSVFQRSMDMFILKINTNENKNVILNFINTIKDKNVNLNLSSKVGCRLIQNKRWGIIRIIALFREIYLNLKYSSL